jgi:hypothetical protein
MTYFITFHGLAISLGTLQGKHREMEGEKKKAR